LGWGYKLKSPPVCYSGGPLHQGISHMALTIDVNDLIAYTDWQREKWRSTLREHSDALRLSAGPNGDDRFNTIGDLIKHIFSAEKRYIERLSNRTLTDPSSIPSDEVEALFRFGQQSRRDLRQFIDSLPAAGWDIAEEHNILGHKLRLTPRKIIVHVFCMKSDIGRRLLHCCG